MLKTSNLFESVALPVAQVSVFRNGGATTGPIGAGPNRRRRLVRVPTRVHAQHRLVVARL